MSLTRARDLRDGKTVWSSYPVPTIKGARLKRSQRAEVVVVGGGISGAMIAQALAEAGMPPLILDRRKSAFLGSTAASTALLQFELDTPLVKLGSDIGTRKAGRVWLASRDAVNELRTRSMRLGIHAHLESRPSLYLAGNVLDAKDLQHEATARQKLGLASEFIDRKSLRHHFGISRAAALLSHGNAEANPIELAAGFLRRAIQDGARFHAPHVVVDLHSGKRDTTLLLDGGLEIRARHVVLCTGYELAKIVPADGARILSTWAISTRPQPGALWPQKALLWEASDPYLYARTTTDGRVVCGGEDEDFSDEGQRDSLTPQKAKRIATKLQRLFPDLDCRAELSWSGSFGGSRNGMPTIGAIPGHPRCHAVMGYGGNGTTFSMLATRIIMSAIKGRPEVDAALFAFR